MRVAVVGLGRFGQRLCLELVEGGVDVLAIDRIEAQVNSVRNTVQRAVIADGSDFEVISGLVSKEFDYAVVGIARNIEASVLCTLNLKKLGIENVVARASSYEHGEILQALGVNQVVFPESESANELARRVLHPNLVEYIPLAEGYEIVEIDCPKEFAEKSLQEIDVRRKYQVVVVAIRSADSTRTDIMPRPDKVLKKGEKLVVIGRTEDIIALSR